jgi:hypothetical protein
VYSVLVSQGNVDGKEDKEDASEDVHDCGGEGTNSDDVGVTSFEAERWVRSRLSLGMTY